MNQPKSKPNQGSFMAINKVIPKSKAIRMNIAKPKPNRVALFRSASGNFPVTIEIKIMLSIPKIISKKVRVKSAIQASGFKNTSILFYVFKACYT